MPAGPIAIWSSEDKIKATIQRSKKYLGPVLGQQVDALLEPGNLAIMAATLAIWGGSHFIGVGEVVDVILLLVGAAMIGPAVVDVAENLIKFGKCINATTEEELDIAARAFADAAVKGGITVLMAVLLRKSAKGLQASRAPGVARPSVMQIMKPKGPIGLPQVGADPQPGALWSRLPAVGDAAMKAGAGETTAFGEIFYSLKGSATQQQLALFHETVHRFFSPRIGILRTFRARLNIASYSKSAILQYLEEAMAETYAQLRVNGFRGLIDGITFPIGPNYVTISQLTTEGIAIGTILVGGHLFYVSVQETPPKWVTDLAQAQPKPAIQGDPIMVPGGRTVTVAPGSSLSDIARKEYGDWHLWPLIYDLNKDRIGPNPNRVSAGARLTVLPLSTYSAEEQAAARRRAPSWKDMPL